MPQAQRLHHLEVDAAKAVPGSHRILSGPVGVSVVFSDAALEMGRHTLRDSPIAGPFQSQRCTPDHHFGSHGAQDHCSNRSMIQPCQIHSGQDRETTLQPAHHNLHRHGRDQETHQALQHPFAGLTQPVPQPRREQ